MEWIQGRGYRQDCSVPGNEFFRPGGENKGVNQGELIGKLLQNIYSLLYAKIVQYVQHSIGCRKATTRTTGEE